MSNSARDNTFHTMHTVPSYDPSIRISVINSKYAIAKGYKVRLLLLSRICQICYAQEGTIIRHVYTLRFQKKRIVVSWMNQFWAEPGRGDSVAIAREQRYQQKNLQRQQQQQKQKTGGNNNKRSNCVLRIRVVALAFLFSRNARGQIPTLRKTLCRYRYWYDDELLIYSRLRLPWLRRRGSFYYYYLSTTTENRGRGSVKKRENKHTR